MKWFKYLLFVVLVLFALSCSGVAGGGTETGDPGANEPMGNGLIGGVTVLDADGDIAVEKAYVWADNHIDQGSYSEAQGDYYVRNLRPGKHILYAKWVLDGVVYVGKSDVFEIGAVEHGSLKPYIYLGENIVLELAAQVAGKIPFHENVPYANGKVVLKDTVFRSSINSAGDFLIKDVPAGIYQLEVYNGSTILYQYSIEVFAGEFAYLDVLPLY